MKKIELRQLVREEISKILKEEKKRSIFTSRNIEGRKKTHIEQINQRIQDYIKGGSQGDLDLRNTPIISLPNNLTKVGGLLDLSGTPITSLPDNLTKVEGDLDLTNSLITSLPDNLKVGGHLNLRKTPLSTKYSKDEIRKMIEDKGGDVKGDIFI